MTMTARTGSHEQEALIGSVTTLLTDLLRTLLWCVRNHIQVVSFRGWRGAEGNRAAVVVLASPRLHILFGKHCSYQRRAVENGCEVFSWAGSMNGIRVEWEERS